MHSILIAYIQKHSKSQLTEEDRSLIRESFIPKKLRKRQFLLQEGDVCKYMGFVVNGAARQYSIDNKGMEHIIGLFVESWWIGDRESYFNNTPSIYNIDAWEETNLLLLPKENLEQMNKVCAFVEMRIKLYENYSNSSQKRLLSSISHSAEYRYQELMNSNPAFFQRFPQHVIASYLGITKETISRIRNHSNKK